jgi:RNA:NAD 2'-phosphotransferase (TPT1/KptA family)
MNPVDTQTSKLISYWLRHKPEEAGLGVDDFGWVSIEKVLSALRSKNLSLNLEELIALNQSFDKVRWEINASKDKIRATHGHSFAVLLEDKTKSPPETLYHGTAVATVSKIIITGLLPMNRQFVHLSENVERAIEVGKRHGKPFIIEITTEPLVKAGWKFYSTSENVWLTTAIPLQYLNFAPWHEVAAEERKGAGYEELRREVGKSHPLYKHLDSLEKVWSSGMSDDALFKDTVTGKYYQVHLTWSGRQESKDWPATTAYSSFEEWIENSLLIDQQNYYDLDVKK